MKFKKDFILKWCLNNLQNCQYNEEKLYANSIFYPDEKRHLMIKFDENTWFDFKLAKGGHFFKLIREFYKQIYGENISDKEIILQLMKENAFDKKEKFNNTEKEQRTNLLNEFYNYCIPLKKTEKDFLIQKRNLTEKQIENYQLKYCIYDNIPFIVIPFFNYYNELFYIQLYNYTKNSNYPKYHNIGSTIHCFFGEHLQKDEKILKIVEGVFDAIICNGVAKIGATIRKEQLNLFRIKKFEKIYLIQDNDKVGFESIEKDYKTIINNFPEYVGKTYFFNWNGIGAKDINELGIFDESRMIIYNPITYINYYKNFKRV